MESVAMLSFLVSAVSFIIALIVLLKFFSLCYDMRVIRFDISKFVEYYFKKENYRIQKDSAEINQ